MSLRRSLFPERVNGSAACPRMLVPLALLGIVVLSYGLWIPWLGWFGNDLAYIYYYHLLGPWGPGAFASVDRPASALFYAISTAVLGENLVAYHGFLLVLRWLSGVLLWWVLRLVWPERKVEAFIAALLLVIYPGFRQNPVSVEFILHFAVLDLFLLSLAATLKMACQPRNAGWLALSVTGAASLFWLEYFIGLEVLRPIFLWIVTRRAGMTGKVQVRRILWAWVPPLLAVLAFLYWRVFIFSFPTYRPVLLDELSVSVLGGLIGLGKSIVRDLVVVLLQAWRQVAALPAERALWPGFLALVVVSFGLVLFALHRLARSEDPFRQALAANRYWGESLFAIGIVTLLAGGFPFWVTGIPVTVAFPWDRSMLSYMPGACLLMVGLVEMFVTPRYRPLLAAGLVSLAVGMHLVNAYEYRQEWNKLQSFFWQLTWRAPGLEPGTLILFDVIPLNRYSDNDLTSLLNWTYAPDHTDRQIPYKFFDLTLRLDDKHAGLPGIEKGLPVVHDHRGLLYETTTSQTLALHYDPPACLKVLDPQDARLPGLPDRLVQVLPMTNPAQVRAEGQAHPPVSLGEEPEHDWCYYFQKADLARQQGRWEEIAALGAQADQAGLQARGLAELLPFIEGYARSGNWVQAQALSAQAGQQVELRPALCQTWQRINQSVEPAEQPHAESVQEELGCQP